VKEREGPYVSAPEDASALRALVFRAGCSRGEMARVVLVQVTYGEAK
jgi:hypothetical protein